MKKTLAGVLFIIMMSVAATALADDAKVTVGLKIWSNKFEEKTDVSGVSQTTDFGTAVMAGPSINVRFPNNWFAGASYLVTTQDYESKDMFAAGDTLTFARKDLDVLAGYMFTPRFGAFFGYKSISNETSYTLPPFLNNDSLGSWEMKGPGFGVLGNIPLTDAAALYGSFALMSIDSTFSFPDGTSESADLSGTSLEVGVAMAFAEQMSANAGIKVQSFTGEDDAGDTTTDSFAGLILGVNYTF